MTRLLVVPFTASVFSERHEGEFDVDAEVTGAVSLNGDTYDIRIQSVRVGLEVYRPPMVSPRLIAQCEDQLVWAFEAQEASARRHQAVVDEAKAVVGLGVGK